MVIVVLALVLVLYSSYPVDQNRRPSTPQPYGAPASHGLSIPSCTGWTSHTERWLYASRPPPPPGRTLRSQPMPPARLHVRTLARPSSCKLGKLEQAASIQIFAPVSLQACGLLRFHTTAARREQGGEGRTAGSACAPATLDRTGSPSPS